LNLTSFHDLRQENTNEEYRYVLSRAQEDEIRESFLIEKLDMYSMVRDSRVRISHLQLLTIFLTTLCER